MKKLFKKLGFRKMDEMEQSIMFKAQRNAYIFLEIALIAWGLYESYKTLTYHTDLNIFPSMLATTGLLIQNSSQLIMTHNAVKGDEETPKDSTLLRTVIIAISITTIIVMILNVVLCFWG